MPDLTAYPQIQTLLLRSDLPRALEAFTQLVRQSAAAGPERRAALLGAFASCQLFEERKRLGADYLSLLQEEGRLRSDLLRGLARFLPTGEQREVERGIRVPPKTAVPDEPTASTAYARDGVSAPSKILFLASNPVEATHLHIDREVRQVEEGIRLAPASGMGIQFRARWAVRARDLRRALLEEEPDIVHFSGHGSPDGIILEAEDGTPRTVSAKALGSLFSLFCGKVQCVVLNACYTEKQAEILLKSGIPYVTGMRSAIPDRAALAFSVAFYDALASGRDYVFAHQYARAALELEGFSCFDVPFLKK
ncbi:MAG: CHAT domain-containing protein [Saprospiraceae bacterium]|jgi:hypothetical protein